MQLDQRFAKARRYWGRISTSIGVVCLLVLTLLTLTSSRSPAHAATGDWPTYLGNNGHTSFNGSETAINPSSVSGLHLLWTHFAGVAGKITTQPIVANGMVYWGSWDGYEHASSLSDGTDIWADNLGQATLCRKQMHGVISTATVASEMINGVLTTVVYVAGGNNNLYALNANSGNVIWQTLLDTQPGSFLYSSPTVFNGSVYIGTSAYADCQHIQGQFMQVNASTGTVQNTFNIVPAGCLGGSMWTSPTIDETTGMLYFSDGEKSTCTKTETKAEALIELNAATLKFVAAWQVPASDMTPDGDFGSSPTFFNATIGGVFHKMVGLVNKNGIYYAFDRKNISAGPLWKVRLGTNPGPSLSSSAWDGTTLYVAAATTTIGGSNCIGSLRALNPASGAFLWEDCLNFDPIGPVIGVPGLVELGVGTSIMIFDTTNGNQLFKYSDTNKNSNFEGPGTISNGVLYHGNLDGNLYAFVP